MGKCAVDYLQQGLSGVMTAGCGIHIRPEPLAAMLESKLPGKQEILELARILAT
jgi:hypothetical protein